MIEKLQQLFGFEKKIALLRGKADWHKKNEGDDRDEVPFNAPLCDWEGLSRFLKYLSNYDHKPIEDVLKENALDTCGFLSIGGRACNLKVGNIEDRYKGKYKYRLAHATELGLNGFSFLSKNDRYYSSRHGNNTTYRKSAGEKAWFIVDESKNIITEYSPKYKNGNCIMDSIILSVVPDPDFFERKHTIITPVHGSGIRIADLFFDKNLLKRLEEEVAGRSYYQAIYTVNNDPDDNITENYEKPELKEVYAISLG